jgi:hypothetical protein
MLIGVIVYDTFQDGKYLKLPPDPPTDFEPDTGG